MKDLPPRIEERIEELKRQKSEEVLAQIRELAESIGKTLESIFEKRKRRKQTTTDKTAMTADGADSPTYRNPESGENWSGRGRRPKWVTEHLDGRGTLEELTV